MLGSHCLNVEAVYVYIFLFCMFIIKAYPLLTLKNPLLFGCVHLNGVANDSSLCLCVYLFCLSVDNK